MTEMSKAAIKMIQMQNLRALIWKIKFFFIFCLFIKSRIVKLGFNEFGWNQIVLQKGIFNKTLLAPLLFACGFDDCSSLTEHIYVLMLVCIFTTLRSSTFPFTMDVFNSSICFFLALSFKHTWKRHTLCFLYLSIFLSHTHTLSLSLKFTLSISKFDTF